MQGALGHTKVPEVETALFPRNHPDWAAWLDEIYGTGNWKPLLEQLKPMWTRPLKYTAKDFAHFVCPALVFFGDRDDLVSAEMYRQLPKAELAVIPDADHGAFFTAKVANFQAVLLDFLERHGS